ncbi:phosphoglycerate mutase [Mesorhizobium sp. Root554]|uniref:histidine phosphatase family protein n=1 Tax=unclassified Mesorhizobium TaxID=325217 RepID=UPI0006F6C427|nr:MULTISPECIES: histidine phosphatase family protein [unclassified Mesorhizobium]KQZ15267.1 phosphoglycerate mutase [Mesorhizobium sp. Root1471]KQZ37776.1 phosphoglycerate mutase [Mesorhizobium sp. Root554]
MIGVYLTHPQVEIDASVPVPQWGLSAVGAARVEALLARQWISRIGRVVSSDERKAIETARPIAETAGCALSIEHDMGENDRSSTGFLEPSAFEKAADAFFLHPEMSWNGWERAADASARIRGAVERVLQTHPGDIPILFVGHGAVGTLLKCHLAGQPIARSEDQPAGGGNLFAFRLRDRALLCGWTAMEEYPGFSTS